MLQNYLSKKLLLITLIALLTQKINAQITIGASNYTTLKAAFDGINAGNHTGAISIVVSGNTTETASCVLNESGNGAANYSSINISTSGGPWLITGFLPATHLLDFNGADNVTIDGGSNLTISNTSNGGTSAIRFNNDATNNIIKNATIIAGTSVAYGVIYFANGIATGNDNNTIQNCDITGTGTFLPLNGIYSSSSTAGAENNNNTVLNCKIYDHFNATTSFAAINLDLGNYAWTISGNKIYQTASRTITTALTAYGIVIKSGTGYSIANNTIGYSTAAGTGTYTMASTVALKFNAIYGGFSSGGNNDIQGNTITAISFTTSDGTATGSGVFCGINIVSGRVNIGTTAGNTIGSASGVNNLALTSTTSQALLVGICSATTGDINIKNNTLGGLKSGGMTAAVAGAVFGINITGASASVAIEGNTIGNTTANNMRAGTLGSTTGSSILAGINITNSSIGSMSILNNTIQNLSSYGISTGGFLRGINTPASGLCTIAYTITGNTINNLTTTGASTTYSNGLVAANGISCACGVSATISENTISNIAGAGTPATGVNITGIGLAGINNPKIFKNKIFGITNTSTSTSITAPATASGILIRSGNGSFDIYNNMISLGTGQTTNTAFVGILGNHGTSPDPTNNIYFNSIYIGGTANTGAQPSFGIARTDFSVNARIATFNIKNNIIVNERSGGTGKHYTLANNYGATVPSATGWTANNNALKANTSTIGWWGAAKDFVNWQSSSLNDANSITGIVVNFVNTATADLHLNMGTNATPLESGGANILTYNTDFDNQARPGPSGSSNGGATSSDIGADEFDGAPGDLVGPTITIAPIVSSCNTISATFDVTVFDETSIPTTGALVPRVYYKKGAAGTWYSTAGTLSSGTGITGTWNFVVNYALMGGVTGGDFIYYYVVAQDNINNLSSNPTGVAGTSVNSITSAPLNPLSYQIAYSTFGGTYQVGSAQAAPFNTLTNAIKTFNNACALSGAVVFELTDANYNSAETFPIIINKHANASATNSLTLKPATGNSATISGSTNNVGLMRCFNSFTTIDGSNSGGTTQNMTFVNTSASTPRVIEFMSNGASAISDCVLKNCNLTNGSQNSPAVLMADMAGTAGLFSNLTIQNNNIQKASVGIWANGTSGSGTGLIISQNTLNATGGNSIKNIGIQLDYCNGAQISKNIIGNFEAFTGESDKGIWLGTGTSNTTVSENTITSLNCTNTGAFAPIAIHVNPGAGVSGNSILKNTISTIYSVGSNLMGTTIGISVSSGTNILVESNSISDVKNTNTGGWGAAGINISSTDTKVIGNFVSNVIGKGWAGAGLVDNGNGIVLSGGSNLDVYHNTILLTTDQEITSGTPSAMLITSGVSGNNIVNLKNNIFVNRQTVGSQRYAILCAASSSVFASIDNNDYYSAGPNLGAIASVPRATIADIQTGFGGNTSSVSENPTFVSATDLHLNMGTTITKLESTGAVIAGIITDIDGQTRPGPVGSTNGGGTAPDMGADEFDGKPTSIKLSAKVFLAHVDTLTGLMDDYVKTLPNFPSSDPYAVAGAYNGAYTHVNNPIVATVSPTVLAVTGNNAIVDWMFVELRTGTPGSITVAGTKAALLQKDGDLVAMDGISPLSFDIPSGNYYIKIRHRNNLGFCTENTLPISSTATPLNFTNNSISLFGATPTYPLTSTISIMVSGDANSDGSIDAFDTIDWEIQNGLFDDYINNSDYNMDGSVDAFDTISWEINNGKFEECQ